MLKWPLMLQISRFTSEKDNTPRIETVPWESLCSVFEVRPTKEGGPCWSPFTFNGTRGNATAEKASCLVFDLDQPLTLELAEALESYTYIAHTTFTPGRWRIILRLDRRVTVQEYKALWAHYFRVFGSVFDAATKDTARIYYEPTVAAPIVTGSERHTNDAYIIEVDKVLFSIAGVFPNPKVTAPPTKKVENFEAPAAAFDIESYRAQARAFTIPSEREAMLDFLSMQWAPASGGRDNSLHVAINHFMCRMRPWPSMEECMYLVEHVLDRMECQPEGRGYWWGKLKWSVERAIEFREQREEKSKAVAAVAGANVQSDSSAPEWRDALQRKKGPEGDEAGPVLSNGYNLEIILRNDSRFKSLRFNDVTRRVEVSDGPLKDHNLDTIDTALSNWLMGSEYRMKLSRAECMGQLQILMNRRAYDPLKEYLEKLPKWDGVPRISRLLYTHCGVDNPNADYVEGVSRKFFLSVAARGLNPGTQVDTMLILQGEGGTGKTSFVRVLGGEFAAETTLDLHNKDSLMLLTGRWLVEMSELSSMRKSDVETFRGFLTRTSDVFRPPYGREPQEFKRRCVFVGTSNDDEMLEDNDGARRYWPVSVGVIDVQGIKAIRDQLWAEAVAAVRAGERHYFDNEERKKIMPEVNLFQKSEGFAEALREWFMRCPKEKRPERMTVYEALGKLDIPAEMRISRTMEMRMGRAMTQLKFGKGRDQNGDRKWYRVTPASLLTGVQAKPGGVVLNPVGTDVLASAESGGVRGD